MRSNEWVNERFFKKLTYIQKKTFIIICVINFFVVQLLLLYQRNEEEIYRELERKRERDYFHSFIINIVCLIIIQYLFNIFPFLSSYRVKNSECRKKKLEKYKKFFKINTQTENKKNFKWEKIFAYKEAVSK